ncbi:hypothetical protein [Streptomyces sp. NBC_00878]|uniref:hypothetical protein n=1 Tax=Streptomyces sp. NBC_00878 TaxID=2975854 RepID=UPI002251B707|nr:hypothetical protein [Streptomyces sp. NBC_00878]MCX4905721.1 hypothetical protein [Streptomyces sp. NBC_00878]
MKTALEKAYPGKKAQVARLEGDQCLWLGDTTSPPRIAEKNDTAGGSFGNEWFCRFGEGLEYYKDARVLPAAAAPPALPACRALDLSQDIDSWLDTETPLNGYSCVYTAGARAVLHPRRATKDESGPWEVLYVLLETRAR